MDLSLLEHNEQSMDLRLLEHNERAWISAY